MSGPLAFLDEPQGSEKTPAPVTPEPAATETPPPSQEPAQPAVEAAPPQPEVIPPGHVPIAALLDTREKWQAAEKRLAELEAAKPPQSQIDPVVDPEGFARDFEGKVEKVRQDTLFDTSKRFALKAYSADIVQAAETAYEQEVKTNPAAFQTLLRQPDPYEFVVKWHKQQQDRAKLGDDGLDAWFEKQFAARVQEKGYVLPERDANGKFVAAAPAPATQTPLPKPSLASAPAASGSAPKTPVGEGVAFDAVFQK